MTYVEWMGKSYATIWLEDSTGKMYLVNNRGFRHMSPHKYLQYFVSIKLMD